jgi:Zn-dependent protease
MGFDSEKSLSLIMFKFVALNVGLAVFNMIPIPPLDGSKVAMSLMPRDWAARYEATMSQLSWVFLGLLVFRGSAILGPIQSLILQGLLSIIQ